MKFLIALLPFVLLALFSVCDAAIPSWNKLPVIANPVQARRLVAQHPKGLAIESVHLYGDSLVYLIIDRKRPYKAHAIAEAKPKNDWLFGIIDPSYPSYPRYSSQTAICKCGGDFHLKDEKAFLVHMACDRCGQEVKDKGIRAFGLSGTWEGRP